MNNLFNLYEEILLRENAKYNLTAITDPAEIRQKHFGDSAALLDVLDIPLGVALLDVGSGAGFPGVPLKILRPDLQVTLMDSTAKKANFLRALSAELGLPFAVHCARAEQAAHDPAMRERFGVVVSRAVAPLPLLCELCLPFAAIGGTFAAYKGTREKAAEELAQAERAIALLGAELAEMISETTAYGERTLILLKKVSRISTAYPRNHGAMCKKSL